MERAIYIYIFFPKANMYIIYIIYIYSNIVFVY